MSKMLKREEMLAKLKEGKREPVYREVKIPVTTSQNRDMGKATEFKTVKIPISKRQQEMKKLSVENRNLKQQIDQAPVEEKHKLVLQAAMKHLKEQKEKGNVDPKKSNLENKKFEAHQLSEVNEILYGLPKSQNSGQLLTR